MGEAHRGAAVDSARRRGELSAEQLEQRRLARAVVADERDAVAGARAAPLPGLPGACAASRRDCTY